MAKFTLPGVGALDFPASENGYWEFAIKVAGRDVEVDVNVEEGQLTEDLFDQVKQFAAEAARFESVARAAIRSDFAEDPDGSSNLYLSHHAEDFSDDERLEHFGTADAAGLGVDQLLKSIHLARIGLYPASDDYVAVFDFTIDEELTDYILAVEFGKDGSVTGISMDS